MRLRPNLQLTKFWKNGIDETFIVSWANVFCDFFFSAMWIVTNVRKWNALKELCSNVSNSNFQLIFPAPREATFSVKKKNANYVSSAVDFSMCLCVRHPRKKYTCHFYIELPAIIHIRNNLLKNNRILLSAEPQSNTKKPWIRLRISCFS